MYFYFSSGFPAAIKFNGIYYGVIHDTVKSCNFEDNFTPFIEVCPLSSSGNTLNFLPEKEFLDSPPDGVTVTDMRGGYLLQFPKKCSSSEFKVIKQEKFPDLLLTVFKENDIKVSIETKTDFFVETINLDLSSVEVKRFSINNKNFIALNFLGEYNTLSVYLIDQKITKVFSREVQSFSFDNGFSTTEVFKDMAKHKVVSEWVFENNTFHSHLKTVTCDPNFKIEKLPLSLLPFAFFEDLLVGADVSEYLGDSIKKNADKLGSYLGKFIGVMPPPLFRNIDEVGLIYPNGKNKYKVDYCTLEFTDRKITNVKKSDV